MLSQSLHRRDTPTDEELLTELEKLSAKGGKKPVKKTIKSKPVKKYVKK